MPEFVYNRCTHLVQVPVSNLKSDMVRLIHGWRQGGIINNGPAIRREKKEGEKSYRGWQ